MTKSYYFTTFRKVSPNVCADKKTDKDNNNVNNKNNISNNNGNHSNNSNNKKALMMRN